MVVWGLPCENQHSGSVCHSLISRARFFIASNIKMLAWLFFWLECKKPDLPEEILRDHTKSA